MGSDREPLTESRQEYPQVGVDEISLSGGWYVWYVHGFGIEESDAQARLAEEAGEEVKIIYAD